jgi:AraC-like DNA-binding protein
VLRRRDAAEHQRSAEGEAEPPVEDRRVDALERLDERPVVRPRRLRHHGDREREVQFGPQAGGQRGGEQHEPAHAWTVAELAARSGVSRAALGRRFTDLVGEPPMAYLAGWRLALAADLLREPDATIAAVARRVGYGSPFALSAAFKRVRGISPRQHRERCPRRLVPAVIGEACRTVARGTFSLTA